MEENAIQKEDYEEPVCPFCVPGQKESVPTGRILEKLDQFFARDDYAGAERHLAYWMAEAGALADFSGQLTVANEQIGLFRKTDQEEKGLAAIDRALRLANELNLTDSVTYGTTLINAATGFKAFGQPEKALPLYEQARALYEKWLDPADERFGGLYNNTALTLTALSRFREAEDLYEKAIAVMARQPHGEAEMAITCCNLADLAAQELGTEDGEEKIRAYLEKAEALLASPDLPHDGHYAFVCEKCAPTFGYYGFFLTEARLSREARDIYERS